MKKNYERYRTVTTEEYEKKGGLYYFARLPANRILLPRLREINGCRILDVGLGSGMYSRILLQKNEVMGLDRNPHLCSLPITVIDGDATELTRALPDEKFDIIFSTWMTEYLDRESLSRFFCEARKLLADRGRLMSTIISPWALGYLYVTLARRIRHIEKFGYHKSFVRQLLEQAGFTSIQIYNLHSWLKIPWAYWVVAS